MVSGDASSSSNGIKRKSVKPGSTTSKKQKTVTQDGSREWPSYFHDLFKALNTVLAFCSSRRSMAPTFGSIRGSVENLLKGSLDLGKVSEIKALCPDLVKFAYIPKNDLLIYGSDQPVPERKTGRRKSPDYSEFGPSQLQDSQDHVLVLEFKEPMRGRRPENPYAHSLPPSLTPAAMKKLVEKRNAQFCDAVNELLAKTSEVEDPVSLLQVSGRRFAPVNTAWNGDTADDPSEVPSSNERPSATEIIDRIRTQDWYKDQILFRQETEKKAARQGTLEITLSVAIANALSSSRQISSLYCHQAEAINALTDGSHVIVSTPTASGKSVIYQVPMLRFLEKDPDSTFIFVYPTKALAQDQRVAVQNLLSNCSGLDTTQVASYDGDTPQEERRQIRENASIIFTNFDMIHFSILPHEDLWRRFFKNLKLIAVDELHYYTGLLGSHVAQVMRRLRRICAAIGNRRVQFVSCSATIANPLEHMRNIFGVENVTAVTEDGAPSGHKEFLVWNPPLKVPGDHSLGRVNATDEATGLMRFLMKRGFRVILFCQRRKSCELAMKIIRAELTAEGRLDILEKVMAYRGGSPLDRRRIEREAFSGQLHGIIATNALELGVDIGVLDVVIVLGFPPGGLASFRQQIGRAGRRTRDSLTVFVPEPMPMDEHYLKKPEDLLRGPVADIILDLKNPLILEAHLQCAGTEMPVTLEDAQYFGPMMKEVCDTRLSKDADGWYHTHPKFLPYPAKHVNLRGVEEEKYVLIDITEFERGGNAKLVEEIEISRALFEVYEGGVFMHQGLTFIIHSISHDSRVVHLRRADVNWITGTDVDPIKTHRIREVKKREGAISQEHAFYGRIKVQTTVYGFYKIRNGCIIDQVDLECLPWERETVGFWLDVPESLLQLLVDQEVNPAEAIHSAQHAVLNRMQVPGELRTECKAPEKEYKTEKSKRKRPARLIFYEPAGKGGGLAAKSFDRLSHFIGSAYDQVVTCECEKGCDSCILDPFCRGHNVVLSKVGAKAILQALLGLPVSPEEVPPPEHLPGEPVAHHQTVVEADVIPTQGTIEVERD
ncbi:P-loop containing nucleoside triphosphate hydrolase protein [Thelephora terrestris]|uniref:P-loop containing nucleoside triphosphate hydrolase protein n=1 Tax=Thelephora terrestris TaxID=56493 RepID=A0A9P6HRD8_9AGAM|nr:P-loop containing nucleoside triphosphate hydrolase protein [Thelephora terrestris]